MKLRHRQIASLGVFALLVLAACGDDSPSTAGSPSTSGSETSAGAGGGDRPEVKVAFVAPLTGGNSTFATQMLNSAELAASQYNESADSACRITVLSYDDKGTAEDATRVAQRALTADGASVLVGGYAGVEALAMKEIAERQETVFLSPSTLALALVEDARFTFRISPNLLDYPNSYAAFVADQGYERPAIIADDGPTGDPLTGPLIAALEEEGITVAGPPVIFPANSTDMTASVQQIAGQNPDSLVILGAVAADQGLVIRTAAEQGLDVPMMGNSAIASPDAQTVAGAAYGTSETYTFNNTDPNKPEYTAYVEAYEAEFGPVDGSITEAADQTYDAMNLLGAALDVAGCDADGPALADTIRGLPAHPAAAGGVDVTLSFADGQEAFPGVRLVPFRVVDGSLEPVS